MISLGSHFCQSILFHVYVYMANLKGMQPTFQRKYGARKAGCLHFCQPTRFYTYRQKSLYKSLIDEHKYPFVYSRCVNVI